MNVETFKCIQLLAIVLLMGTIYAHPQYHHTTHDSKSAKILRFDNDNIGVGNYNFRYQTSDGISREENAEFKTSASSTQGFYVVKGSYSYVGDDGVTYTVNYIADENGYRAIGSHIPKA